MKSVCVVHHEVAELLHREPEHVKGRFFCLLGTFETNWPRLTAFLMRDRRIAYRIWQRSIQGMTVTYTQEFKELLGHREYAIVGVSYMTIRHIYANDRRIDMTKVTRVEVPGTGKTMDEIRREGSYE